jgi:hypothetical protein
VSSELRVGDARAILPTLPDASVDLVVTSPPFLGLRAYLPPGHADKRSELGSESTPGAYLDALLELVEQCDRVLAPHGSLVVELGDSYAGGSASGTDQLGTSRYPNGRGMGPAPARTMLVPSRERRPEREQTLRHGADGGARLVPVKNGPGWPLEKSLCLVPSTFAFALAYGRNPWTDRDTPRWRVRNLVAWCRPNPPVGNLSDKFRPATTYLTVACKARDRYFDLDAVRNATGTPPLDYWELSTQPFAGAHFATWPERLVAIPVDAMTPRAVCTSCGRPRRRLVDETRLDQNGETVVGDWNASNYEPGAGYVGDQGANRRADGRARETIRETRGWSDCGCGAPWRRGVVLDPFAGTGTTLRIAEGLGRDSIGVELDERNVALAIERCGMFLTVTDTPPAPALVDVELELGLGL